MARRSWPAALAALLVASSLIGVPLPSAARRHHHPRSYDTHAYYVLETRGDSGLDADALARSVGAELVEQVGELEGHWLVRARKDVVSRGHEPYDLVKRGTEERDAVMERYWTLDRRRHLGSIASLERQTPRLRAKRDRPYVVRSDGQIGPREDGDDEKPGASLSSVVAEHFGITDPLWPKQWHLVNDDIESYTINVTGLWDEGIAGRGTRVAVIDDGLDMNSDDLADNYFAEGSWDYNDHNPTPVPRLSDDQHGTRCAGEIAAVKNDVCGVGVAYEAKVAGIRILSAAISDADEASALNYAYQENDIYSCSWGPPDDGKSMEAPSRLIFKAILNGVQKGRGGKGSIFVFASGNGGALGDQCNFDGYTNSIYSITVSAVDRKEAHPYYSEVCSANMVVTYSSGSGDNIHTTDVGKNQCTDRHGGTSAAAPLAAGIFALALQARPDLTWRDMQHLAVDTAVPVVANDPDWQITATGRHYNHKFGFGKLDAWAMVQRAKTWQLVKPQAWFITQNVAADAEITSEGATSVIEIKRDELDDANFERLEHVTVAVNIVHRRRGNVEVILTSPRGVRSVLAAPRQFDDASTGFPGWVFMSVKHWGEDPVGAWTLRVLDQQKNPRNGTFQNWAMGFWGECIDPSKQEPFKMPDDAQIHLPPSPTATGAEETATEAVSSTDTTPVRPTKKPITNPPPAFSDSDIQTHKTKTIVRPTAHLPGDHDAAATSPSSSATPLPLPLPSADEDEVAVGDDENSYLDGGMSGVLKRTSSWVFVAAGTVIILSGATVALLLLRRRRRLRKSGLSTGARPGGYEFEPIAGEDDGVPMGRLEAGNGHEGRNGHKIAGGGGKTTRDLYDAFGVGSDSEEEDDDGEKRGLRRDPDVDDHYMDSFLADDSQPLSSKAHDDSSTASLPRRERESRHGRTPKDDAKPLFDADEEA